MNFETIERLLLFMLTGQFVYSSCVGEYSGFLAAILYCIFLKLLEIRDLLRYR